MPNFRNKIKMEIKIKVSTTYKCSLERAFKTPFLCDISKVHTGYGFMPKMTHCTEDGDWGQINSCKNVYAAKSFSQKGRFASVDKIFERVENSYWKFQVNDFQSWMLGFYKFVGVWKTTETELNNILIQYTYTLYSNNPLFYPLNWLFAKIFWKNYMKRVLENVRQMTYNNEPYQYE